LGFDGLNKVLVQGGSELFCGGKEEMEIGEDEFAGE
jgi:hypothetical protein